MIKTFATVALATPLLATSAYAGTYLNVESNSSFLGTDYTGTLVETHVGYEHTVDNFKFYVQGGPALVSVDDLDNEVEFSAKTGLSVDATENLNLYGEYSVVGGDDVFSNIELGAVYRF